MGVIQNNVNQMLGVGALIAGKARTDYNNSVMASENIDTRRRQELYNKELNNGLNSAEKEAQKQLNNKFNERFNKYTGNWIFKNSELRRYYESQNVDRNIALDQMENDNNEVAAQPIVSHTQEDPEYEKATEADIEEYNNQPSIQQVMAEEQMNKIDEMSQFKTDTKNILNIRKDFVSKRLGELNIRPKAGFTGRKKYAGNDKASRNKLNPAKFDKDPSVTLEGLEEADRVFRENNLYDKKENK